MRFHTIRRGMLIRNTDDLYMFAYPLLQKQHIDTYPVIYAGVGDEIYNHVFSDRATHIIDFKYTTNDLHNITDPRVISAITCPKVYEWGHPRYKWDCVDFEKEWIIVLRHPGIVDGQYLGDWKILKEFKNSYILIQTYKEEFHKDIFRICQYYQYHVILKLTSTIALLCNAH